MQLQFLAWDTCFWSTRNAGVWCCGSLHIRWSFSWRRHLLPMFKKTGKGVDTKDWMFGNAFYADNLWSRWDTERWSTGIYHKLWLVFKYIQLSKFRTIHNIHFKRLVCSILVRQTVFLCDLSTLYLIFPRHGPTFSNWKILRTAVKTFLDVRVLVVICESYGERNICKVSHSICVFG